MWPRLYRWRCHLVRLRRQLSTIWPFWCEPKPLPGHEFSCRFAIETAPLVVPPQLPEELAALLRAQRARLESGVLLEELAHAAEMGAVVDAQITETGLSPGTHWLRVASEDRSQGLEARAARKRWEGQETRAERRGSGDRLW